jgi:hypothetical protein
VNKKAEPKDTPDVDKPFIEGVIYEGDFPSGFGSNKGGYA